MIYSSNRSPFHYTGSKRNSTERIVNELIARYPDAESLTSPFIGGGSVELGWMHFTGKPCLGADIDYALINCWNWLIEYADDVADVILMEMPVTREKWQAWYSRAKQKDFFGNMQDAAHFWLLTRTKVPQCWGYSPAMTKGFNREAKYRKAVETLRQFQAPHLTAIHQQFEDTIRHSNSVIYADPPFYGVEFCYEHQGEPERFPVRNHHRLAECLRKHPHGFVLSYGDCPEIRELYDWADIQEIDTVYISRNLHEEAERRVTELMITPR